MNLLCKALLSVASLTLLVPSAASAQTGADGAEAEPSGEAVVSTDQSIDSTPEQRPGELMYRVWGDRADNPAFADGADQRMALRQFIRGRLDLTSDKLEFHAEMDLLAGQIAGDQAPTVPEEAQTGTRPTRDPFDSGRFVDPREFYAQWLTPVGQLRGGLQTSQWGLGILANSGSVGTEGLFNQHFGGDRVLRAIFATAPLRPISETGFTKDFYLAVGADVVWRDENADLLAGDQAIQGVVAAMYDTEPTKGGAYVVYRDQTDRDEDFLRVWAFDLYGDHEFTVADDFRFRAAAEGALLTGETNRTLTQEADPVSVLGLGAAGEFGAHYDPLQLGLQLRAGYASGDANTDDDTLYRFRFDPNYNVGLVLFDYYLPAVTRTSVQAVHDPSRTAQAPKGVDGLVNDGGVENALYVSPRLMYGSQDGFLAGASLLWAQAAKPLYDPYNSFENGGSPTGINGRKPASDDLGMEIDAAAQYRFEPVDTLTLEVKGEYGIFFPGEAFADASGNLDDPQSLGRVRLSALW